MRLMFGGTFWKGPDGSCSQKSEHYWFNWIEALCAVSSLSRAGKMAAFAPEKNYDKKNVDRRNP